MTPPLRIVGWGCLGAVLGVVLSLLALTLYNDHLIVQTLYQIEVQRAKTGGT